MKRKKNKSKKENFFDKHGGAVITQTVSNMCVLNYTPPIPCPICGASTIPMWDENHKDELGQHLWLRACSKCNKVFTPEPELKLIKGLSVVREEKK